MFERILIANRGEIARRIQRTATRLGIETVAVYSDADADAGFVRAADRAVRIGPAAVTESYLRGDAIIAAALEHGARAIHPGYGFVAENAEFARAVAAAGLTFIGPAPETIALMGSKTDSKRAMEAAGIAGVPGYHGDDQGNDTLLVEARKIGFPVLIKASAGGGGKGMRVAPDEASFLSACDGARREAASAFGDDQLLLEKFIERPRHIEVQVFGDHHGHIVHLFERECSVQRRYQKIIEEAPSPSINAKLRQEMTQTAVRAASAVDYRGAGTIEFIVTPDDQFYFMEMNTRLQVEHPVTEKITDVDLVEWQLRVANDEPLPLTQKTITQSGHAIECRVYAEDAFNGFVPSSGRIHALDLPSSETTRIDIDLVAGQSVTPFYDPMIAKFTVHADDRDAAIGVMQAALGDTSIVGPATNVPLLRLLLAHDDYRAGRIDTAYLDRQLDTVLDTFVPPPAPVLAAVAAVACGEANRSTSPWATDGWQASGQSRRRVSVIDANGTTLTTTLRRSGAYWRAEQDDGFSHVVAHEHNTSSGASNVTVLTNGVQEQVRLHTLTGAVRVQWQDRTWELRTAPLYPVTRADASDDNKPGAPMPGKIVKLLVAAGDVVSKGQALVVMEGMKMELTITAARDGQIKTVHFAVGDQVEAEVPLVELEAVDVDLKNKEDD
ncbi:MAG: biotin carboxylase N-terminal domain-containing protein [Gammaproteobacteria bacterium]